MSGGYQNWQVGDLALCISHDGFYAEFSDGWRYPPIGSIRQVKRVILERKRTIRRWFKPNICVLGGVWLVIEGCEGLNLHNSNFRKILPHAPDEEDAETIRLLTGQPATPVAPKTPELV